MLWEGFDSHVPHPRVRKLAARYFDQKRPIEQCRRVYARLDADQKIEFLRGWLSAGGQIKSGSIAGPHVYNVSVEMSYG